MRFVRALVAVALVGVAPRAARGESDDWSITRARPAAARSASRPPAIQSGALGDRLLAQLLAHPADDLALEQLLAWWREGGRSVSGLEAELRERAEAPAASGRAEVALARLLEAEGRIDEALAAFERALSRGESPALVRGLRAKVYASRGRRSEARGEYAAVLALEATKSERESALWGLLELSVDERDFAEARARFAELLRTSARRTRPDELARLFASRGEPAEAAREYRRLVEESKSAIERARHGIELARAELAQSHADEALAASSAARASAPAELRPELDALELEAHRQRGTLRDYAAALSADPRRASLDQLRRAAQLYGELGDDARARSTLEAVLKRAPSDDRARTALAELSLRAGELAAAEQRYRELVRRVPVDSEVLRALAELLLKSGRRDEAIALLRGAIAREPRRSPLRVTARDVYLRWGEQALAAQELDALAKLEPERPTHAIALGERALASGDKANAVALFERLGRGLPPARAELTVARVLGDHDLVAEAVVHAQRAAALQPDAESQSLLASLLERAGRDADAELAWQGLRARSDVAAEVRREARERLAVLYRRMGVLAARTSELEQALRQRPDELESMRLLVALYARDRAKTAARSALLERLIARDPSDREALRELERAQFEAGDAGAALRTAEARLAAGERSEADLLAALELARAHAGTPEAGQLLARVQALAPASGAVQRAIAELALARGDRRGAEAAYARAVAIDARDLRARFALAELEASRGDAGRARDHLLAIVRHGDDEEVVRAALEQLLALAPETPRSAQLLTLLRRFPQRPIVRRYWIERGLSELVVAAQRARDGAATPGERAELEQVVAMALLPLLEALASEHGVERQRALALFEAVPRAEALERLLALAESAQRSRDERSRALLVVGRLHRVEAGPRLRALVARTGRHLRGLALWALAESVGPAASAELRASLSARDPASATVAALELALIGDRAALPSLARAAGDLRPSVRAAALWASDRLGRADDESAWADATGPISTVRLALHADDASALARALLAKDPSLRSDAAALLTRAAPPAHIPRLPFDPDTYVRQVAVAHAVPSAALEVAAVAEAAERALFQGEARAVLDGLTALEGGLVPRAWAEAGGCPSPAWARSLSQRLRAALTELATSSDAVLRERALGLLVLGGNSDSPAVSRALKEADPGASRAVLEAAQVLARTDELPANLRTLLEAKLRDPAWPVRMRAARALAGRGDAAQVGEPIALVRTPPPSLLRAPRCTDGERRPTSN